MKHRFSKPTVGGSSPPGHIEHANPSPEGQERGFSGVYASGELPQNAAKSVLDCPKQLPDKTAVMVEGVEGRIVAPAPPAAIADLPGLAYHSPAPTVGFIYFLALRGEVVYVGQTTNLRARIASHRLDKEFDACWAFECPHAELNAVEEQWIAKLRPLLNRSLMAFGGRGTVSTPPPLGTDEVLLLSRHHRGLSRRTGRVERRIQKALWDAGLLQQSGPKSLSVTLLGHAALRWGCNAYPGLLHGNRPFGPASSFFEQGDHPRELLSPTSEAR